MSSNIYGKEMFTVVPIEGMEAIRKNFAKYQNSEETVRQLFGNKKAVRKNLDLSVEETTQTSMLRCLCANASS